MRNWTFLRIKGLVILVFMLGFIVFKFSFAPLPVSQLVFLCSKHTMGGQLLGQFTTVKCLLTNQNN